MRYRRGMSWWLPSWPLFTAIGVLFLLAMWKLLRSREPLRCPACKAEPDWTGSGSKLEPPVEYRLYVCKCGERLVKESHGPLQRVDGWVPGRKPEAPPSARIER